MLGLLIEITILVLVIWMTVTGFWATMIVLAVAGIKHLMETFHDLFLRR